MLFLAAAVAVTAAAGASAQQSVANAAPTPAPNYDDSYTQDMPYTWMTSEGYKSVDCGYGYNKDESQHCKKADWVRRNFAFACQPPLCALWFTTHPRYSSRTVRFPGLLCNDDRQVRNFHCFDRPCACRSHYWITNDLPIHPPRMEGASSHSVSHPSPERRPATLAAHRSYETQPNHFEGRSF